MGVVQKAPHRSILNDPPPRTPPHKGEGIALDLATALKQIADQTPAASKSPSTSPRYRAPNSRRCTKAGQSL